MLVCGERQPESAAFAHNLVEFLEPPVYRPVIGVAPTSVGASAVSWLGRRHCDHRSDCYYATATIPTAVIHVFIRVASCDRTSLGLR